MFFFEMVEEVCGITSDRPRGGVQTLQKTSDGWASAKEKPNHFKIIEPFSFTLPSVWWAERNVSPPTCAMQPLWVTLSELNQILLLLFLCKTSAQFAVISIWWDLYDSFLKTDIDSKNLLFKTTATCSQTSSPLPNSAKAKALNLLTHREFNIVELCFKSFQVAVICLRVCLSREVLESKRGKRLKTTFYTHGESYSYSLSLWRYRRTHQPGILTHGEPSSSYSTYQPEPLTQPAEKPIIFSLIINSYPKICFCCNSEHHSTFSCLKREANDLIFCWN